MGDFYDRLNILVRSAATALKELLPAIEGTEEQKKAKEEERLLPIQQQAINVFIRTLPVDSARAVDQKAPETLECAYAEASRVEARIEARILPDTRHRPLGASGNNWEKAEFSAAWPVRNPQPPHGFNAPSRSYNGPPGPHVYI